MTDKPNIAALRARLDDVLAEYERMRRNAADTQRRVQAMRGTASTSDGTVRVTVDARGKPVAFDIEPRAYRRYSPSQLATELLRLVDEAAAQVTAEMADAMAPFLPAGVSYADLLSGKADPASLSPGAPLTDETFDAWRARFSGRGATA